MIKHNNKVFG